MMKIQTIVYDRDIELGIKLEEILKHSEVVAIGIDGGGLDDLLCVVVIVQ